MIRIKSVVGKSVQWLRSGETERTRKENVDCRDEKVDSVSDFKKCIHTYITMWDHRDTNGKGNEKFKSCWMFCFSNVKGRTTIKLIFFFPKLTTSGFRCVCAYACTRFGFYLVHGERIGEEKRRKVVSRSWNVKEMGAGDGKKKKKKKKRERKTKLGPFREMGKGEETSARKRQEQREGKKNCKKSNNKRRDEGDRTERNE